MVIGVLVPSTMPRPLDARSTYSVTSSSYDDAKELSTVCVYRDIDGCMYEWMDLDMRVVVDKSEELSIKG